jgi:transposase
MVTDKQVRRLQMSYKRTGSLCKASAQAEMDEKTARKYIRARQLPSEMAAAHSWRTRPDAFEEDWPAIAALLKDSPRLQSTTVFDWVCRRTPGRYQTGQLRSLQRRIKHWRATEGPEKAVMFPQEHVPGRLCASDFTHMTSLGITIAGAPFDHLLFHFVLTYSNWETATVCFSESYESLSEGLQRAFWALGGVPLAHRSDQLSAAVHQDLEGKKAFTRRYEGLLAHYGVQPVRNNAGCPHENGDAEKSHHLIKTAVDQTLLLRGSRNFPSRRDYEDFLCAVIAERNQSRSVRFAEEQAGLRPLPVRRLDAETRLVSQVRASSTILVGKNVYSVPSRLIGETVEVRLGAERLSVYYGGRCMESDIERLRGSNRHRINYRHVIGSLVRKPGAFASYAWREECFPTSRFRMAYDLLLTSHGARAAKEYLRILELAAMENESAVDEALRDLLDRGLVVDFASVAHHVAQATSVAPPRQVHVAPVDLCGYDALMTGVL